MLLLDTPVGFFYYFAVTITLYECKAELFVKRYNAWKVADYDFFQYICLPLLVSLMIASALELRAYATALFVESVPSSLWRARYGVWF